ncbi:LysR family transcriptional regulator [Variovorax paradoxus]|uniref:LysR family transcriptional regulator n=1 Tax=Variovorax paradoxus TaxID=34073 RepID=UPI00277EAB37|nr:LysR substrate-binding domain-containing protein [Variovorax paradoxus]MDQ0589985.1 DNA-binding transcriptional LysR family regulator [Variovorax paradoxus]
MLELRHLRYFVAIAEELNFRKAAERVHIDQTPLSRSIRDLEGKLGVRLLDRSARKLALTPAGEKLLHHARHLFVRLERIRSVVRKTDSQYRPPLRVGVADGIAQPRLTECISAWRTFHPDAPLELAEMSAAELLGALKREEVDVGFSFGLPDDETIAHEEAWSYPLVAILQADHPLSGRGVLPISELLRFPMIACRLDRLPGLRRQMDVVRRQYAARPIISGEAHTLAGYVIRVSAGMGVGVADAGHMETLCRKDIVMVPLAEDIRITTYAVRKRLRPELPEVVGRFLSNIRALH